MANLAMPAAGRTNSCATPYSVSHAHASVTVFIDGSSVGLTLASAFTPAPKCIVRHLVIELEGPVSEADGLDVSAWSLAPFVDVRMYTLLDYAVALAFLPYLTKARLSVSHRLLRQLPADWPDAWAGKCDRLVLACDYISKRELADLLSRWPNPLRELKLWRSYLYASIYDTIITLALPALPALQLCQIFGFDLAEPRGLLCFVEPELASEPYYRDHAHRLPCGHLIRGTGHRSDVMRGAYTHSCLRPLLPALRMLTHKPEVYTALLTLLALLPPLPTDTLLCLERALARRSPFDYRFVC